MPGAHNRAASAVVPTTTDVCGFDGFTGEWVPPQQHVRLGVCRGIILYIDRARRANPVDPRPDQQARDEREARGCEEARTDDHAFREEGATAEHECYAASRQHRSDRI